MFFVLTKSILCVKMNSGIFCTEFELELCAKKIKQSESIMVNNVNEISTGKIFTVAFKRWWIIVLSMVLCAVLMFVYSQFIATPEYMSSAKLGVTNVNMSAYQDSIMGQSLAKECSDILMSDITLERAAERLNSYSFPENGGKPYRVYDNKTLKKMISTVIHTETRYFEMNVTSPDAEEAKIVCDFVAKAFCVALEEENLMNGALGTIIDYPDKPNSPASPNVLINTVMGAIVGIVVAVFALIICWLNKDEIEGEDWLVETYSSNIPLLSVIPDANSASSKYGKYMNKYAYQKAETESQ